MAKKRRILLKTLITLFLILVLVIIGIFTVPGLLTEVTFYWTERTETELKVKAFAEENGIFYSEYPQSLIELLERNPETEAFVVEISAAAKPKSGSIKPS